MTSTAERFPRAGVNPILVTVVLLAGALVAWIVTFERMEGMDAGPGTHLGGFGWYVGIWITMMAAMMLPSVAPMVLAMPPPMTRPARSRRSSKARRAAPSVAGLISTVAGVERGKTTVTGGDKPSASIEGKTEFSFEAFTGADGSLTTVSNAMFGFAPTYKIGKGSGHSEAFGLTFDARYGESAEFEFSTEMAGAVHPRA
jgi:hypothetical protein